MTDFIRATELTPDVEAAIEDAFEYHALQRTYEAVFECIESGPTTWQAGEAWL